MQTRAHKSTYSCDPHLVPRPPLHYLFWDALAKAPQAIGLLPWSLCWTLQRWHGTRKLQGSGGREEQFLPICISGWVSTPPPAMPLHPGSHSSPSPISSISGTHFTVSPTLQKPASLTLQAPQHQPAGTPQQSYISGLPAPSVSSWDS